MTDDIPAFSSSGPWIGAATLVAGTTLHATAQGLAAERGMLEARAPTALERRSLPQLACLGLGRWMAEWWIPEGHGRKNGGAQPTAVYADSAANEVWKAAEAGRSTIQRTVWSEDRSSEIAPETPKMDTKIDTKSYPEGCKNQAK